jgi:hypothetical protein
MPAEPAHLPENACPECDGFGVIIRRVSHYTPATDTIDHDDSYEAPCPDCRPLAGPASVPDRIFDWLAGNLGRSTAFILALGLIAGQIDRILP